MYKIMIIDDNHISVDGICHNIDWSDLNAEVACKAYDGQQALDYLQNNMVDLIISDIEMPQLDGLSLAQNALKINSSIKIILISAFDKFEYAKQAIRLGAFDYIEKPLDYSYLKKIIRNALSMLNKEQRNLEILKQSRPIMIDNFFHKLIQSSSDEARYTLSNYADYLQLNLDYHYYQAIVIQIQNATDIKEKKALKSITSDKINLSAQSRQEHVCTATINYIHQHYQDNTLCLNEIANNVHISPAHLSALFKKQRQQNISDVITDIRIETACNLLKNTNLSLKEISAKVGYSNQYYFSSCFKKKTGQTPSSYR